MYINMLLFFLPHSCPSKPTQAAFRMCSNTVWIWHVNAVLMRLNATSTLFHGLPACICQINGQMWHSSAAQNWINRATPKWNIYSQKWWYRIYPVEYVSMIIRKICTQLHWNKHIFLAVNMSEMLSFFVITCRIGFPPCTLHATAAVEWRFLMTFWQII